MKGIIIYKSKYGSTRQFANWLNEETGFDLYEINKTPDNWSNYDMIIFGSSIHTGFLSLKDFITKNWDLIKDKIVVIMLTSGTSDERFINKVMSRSLNQDILINIKVFPVGGRYLFDKMTSLDRNLIKMAAFFTKNPQTKKGMLTQRNDVKKENLSELLSFIKQKINK